MVGWGTPEPIRSWTPCKTLQRAVVVESRIHIFISVGCQFSWCSCHHVFNVVKLTVFHRGFNNFFSHLFVARKISHNKTKVRRYFFVYHLDHFLYDYNNKRKSHPLLGVATEIYRNFGGIYQSIAKGHPQDVSGPLLSNGGVK